MPGDQEVAYVTDHGDGPGFWAINTATARERLLFLFSALPRAPGGGQPTLSGPALAHAMAPDLSRFAFVITRDGVANIWVASLEASRLTGQLVQRIFEKEAGHFRQCHPMAAGWRTSVKARPTRISA